MTKQEAIEAMQQGKKVHHAYFTPSEYIHIVDGKLVDENDYSMDHEGVNFWTDRQGIAWQTGWNIYEPKNKDNGI